MTNGFPAIPKKRYWLKGLLTGLAIAVIYSICRAIEGTMFLTNEACACTSATGVSTGISFRDHFLEFVIVLIITAPLTMLLGSGIGLLAEKRFKAGLIVLGILAAIIIFGILIGFR